MEKFIIHQLTIIQQSEKQLFQIYLPENAIAVTGIDVSCDKHIYRVGMEAIQNAAIGFVRLFVADTGHKLFSKNLHAVSELPQQEIIGEEFTAPKLYSNMNKSEMFKTYQPVLSTIIEGFYEDLTTGVGGSYPSYKVRIYLRFKMQQS